MTKLIKIKKLIFSLFFLFAFNAQAQPTLSAVFTPSTIGPGSNSTLTYTITNGSASPVSELSFTDVLPVVPGPMTIADPANIQSNCDMGVSGTISAPNGGSTITLSDAQIGAFQSCTISVAVTASTNGVHTNLEVTLSSSAGSSMSLPVDLTVSASRIGFSKSFDPSVVSLGSKSTLTFTLDNSINPDFSIFSAFNDQFPTGMQVASPANASTDCNFLTTPTVTAVEGSTTVSLTGSVDAMSTCTLTLDVLATGVGMLDNQTGELTSTFSANTTVFSSGFAVDTLEVTNTALAISKDFFNDPVPPGGNVELEFTLSNNDRNFAATAVAFSDDLATLVPTLSGLTFNSLLSNDCGGSISGVGGTTIGLTGGTIAAGGSCNVRVDLSVPAAATPGSYTNTSSTVTAMVDGLLVVGNMAIDDLYVEPVPVLTKEFLEAGTLAPDPIVNPGDDVVIRFTVTNTSTTSMATDISFIDELTDGGLNTGFLPFPISAVLPGTACGGSIALVFIDTDRQGLSLTGGSLSAAPGASSTCTFDVTVTIPIDMPTGTYLNTTGEVTATVDGASRIGNTASDTLGVNSAPSLTKAFIDDPVAPGGTVTLQFTLTNSQNALSAATGITFTDDLTSVLAGLTANLPSTPDPACGAGSSLTGSVGNTLLTLNNGTLQPGESCTFSVTLDVPMGAAPGTYTNTTSEVGATVQSLPTSSAPAVDDLNVTGLVFTKEFLDDPVIAGDTVTLRFTIDNIHPTDDATINFFTDILNANLAGLAATGPPSVNDCGGTLSGTTFLTYSGGSVLSGAMCTIEVEVLVPASTADGQYQNVTSNLSAIQGGAITVDPAVDILVVNSSLLQVTKEFIDDPVAPGGTVVMQLTLTNLDPLNAASNVDVTDDLGAVITGLDVVSLVAASNCQALGFVIAGLNSPIFQVIDGTMPAGSSCTVDANVAVPAATAASIYTNTTSAMTGVINGLPVTGDAASDDLEVIDLLLFSKSFDGPTTATGQATLTFTITNPGMNAVEDISFTDDLDSVISGLIATSLPAAPCGMTSSINGISLLAFTGGNLAPMGGSCSFSVDVLVPVSAVGGSFLNVTSDLTSNGLKYADPATADLTIESAPLFSKSFTPNAVGVGQASQLQFTIDNMANTMVANSLAFTDVLPAGLVVDVVPGLSNTCGGTVTAVASSANISLSGGSIAAMASCTIEVSTISNAPGVLVNTTGDLTSSSGNSGTAMASLTVDPQPLFSKAFANNPILINTANQLTFTIDNNVNAFNLTVVDFTDNLPANIVISSPNNISNTCTGGTLTAVAGTAVINYTNGTVMASSQCLISVDVEATTAGDYINTTSALVTNLGTGTVAMANLTAFDVPTLTKSFVTATIGSGNDVELAFEIVNNNTIAASLMSFTDDLDAFITGAVASNLPQTDVCGIGSSLTGTNVISLTNASLAAGTSCQFSVMVTIPLDTPPQSYQNITSPLNGDLGGTPFVGQAGSEATADLMVLLGIPVIIPLLDNWLTLLVLFMGVIMVSRLFLLKRPTD